MIGWNFPPNHYGQRDGLNDSGIETFNGVPYESLAREIIQNSLDAKTNSSTKPVQVHFQLYNVDKGYFPCAEEFLDILDRCKEYWKDSEETVGFYEIATKLFLSDTMPVLKISDFNTTGLLGATDKSQGHDWDNLIKSSGSSNKGSGKGGSFGIGKNAPFACSHLRTLFYSTFDINDNKAFQGVAKITTHNNKLGEETRGTGFYGVKEKNDPIFDLEFIDDFFKRTEVGTDIFIFGFKQLAEWEDEIIKSVVENFFLAIHEGNLVVKVQDTIITSNNLPVLLKKNIFKSANCMAPYYFKSLISPDKHPFIEENFENMGRVELHILPEKNFPKRVAIIRGTGMKIFNKDRFQTPIQFAGVFIARGEAINTFMRKIEPPSHNSWEPERYPDPNDGRRIIKQIYKWMNDSVRTLVAIDDSEELDVEGVSEYLADVAEELESLAFDAEEGVSGDIPKDVEIKIISPKPIEQSASGSSATGTEEHGEGEEPKNGNTHNDGTGGAQQTQPSHSTGGEEGSGKENADENTGTLSRTSRSIKLQKVRTFCIDSAIGRYKVIFEPNYTCVGNLKIHTIGDDGTTEPAPIASANKAGDGSLLTFDSSGKVGPINFSEGISDAIEVVLIDALRCAMGVTANAN